MHSTLLTVILLAFGVVLVGGTAKATRMPGPIMLVLAGLLVALIPGVPVVQPSPDLVLYVLLPPLLYAATMNTSLIAIWANRWSIASLAVGLVLVSGVAVGLTVYAQFPEISLAAGLAVGAVVSPPDAVAATAVARRAGLPRRTVTILEGESLFNDATALTMLHVAVAALAAHGASAGYATGSFLLASVGGAAIGAAGGLLGSWLRTRNTPPIVTASLSVVTPFALFLAGEEAHTSGVIAVVVAGLILSHRSPRDQAAGARLTESSMWSVIQYLLEGAVFALIGLQLPHIVRGVHESTGEVLIACGSVLGVVLAVRPLWLAGVNLAARMLRRDHRPHWRGISIISWAGMRGVISLAAAGSLPLDFPRRNLLLLVTVVVIVGTLGLQGLTLPMLIRKLGVSAPDPRQDALQIAHAQEQAGRAALDRLDGLVETEDVPRDIADRLRGQVEWRTFTGWEKLGPGGGDEAPTRALARLRRDMVDAEREVFVRLRDSGELDEDVLRMIQRRLDLEESMLIGIDKSYSALVGHQEVLPPANAPSCAHLLNAPAETPVADPRECPTCVGLGRRDWVHLRACLSCGEVGCCDSSPLRHATAHFKESGHPVMGSAEQGESWRWCFKHNRIG